jgi:hypothetical protein
MVERAGLSVGRWRIVALGRKAGLAARLGEIAGKPLELLAGRSLGVEVRIRKRHSKRADKFNYTFTDWLPLRWLFNIWNGKSNKICGPRIISTENAETTCAIRGNQLAAPPRFANSVS